MNNNIQKIVTVYKYKHLNTGSTPRDAHTAHGLDNTHDTIFFFLGGGTLYRGWVLHGGVFTERRPCMVGFV